MTGHEKKKEGERSSGSGNDFVCSLFTEKKRIRI